MKIKNGDRVWVLWSKFTKYSRSMQESGGWIYFEEWRNTVTGNYTAICKMATWDSPLIKELLNV